MFPEEQPRTIDGSRTTAAVVPVARWCIVAAIAAATLLAGMFALLPPGAELGALLDGRVDAVEEYILAWGAWGVLASVALMIVHSFLPFPAELVAVANGMIFGAFWGTVITWIGAMLGASIAFGLARGMGRPLVIRILSPGQWERVSRWSMERGAVSLLGARLVPVIAFNLVNYAAALTAVSWWTFLWTTGLGILPFTVLLCVLGDEMMGMPPWVAILFAAAAGALWVGHAVLRKRRGHITQAASDRGDIDVEKRPGASDELP